jgi:hypothetical protein
MGVPIFSEEDNWADKKSVVVVFREDESGTPFNLEAKTGKMVAVGPICRNVMCLSALCSVTGA